MKDDEILEGVGFVSVAKNRLKVLKAVYKPQTPTSIGRTTGLGLNLASRALNELAKGGLVECVNPGCRVGKMYRLTEKGRAVLEYFKEDPA